METKHAAATLSVTIDKATNELVVMFKDKAGKPFSLALNPGIVAGLAVSLFSFGKDLSNSDSKGVAAQFMHLTGAIPGVGPQGQPCLDLVLEGVMHFGVTFPKNAIPTFQKALAILLEKSSEVRGPGRH